jgi:hypothetical protein
MGTLGLFVFALSIWRFMSAHRPSMVLLSATAIWLAVAVGMWKELRQYSSQQNLSLPKSGTFITYTEQF